MQNGEESDAGNCIKKSNKLIKIFIFLILFN